MSRDPGELISRRSLPVDWVLWAAGCLAVLHLVAVVLPNPIKTSQTVAVVRIVLACLILPIPGLPFSLFICARKAGRAPAIGCFELLAVSIAAALAFDYLLVVAIRYLHPPVTPRCLSAATLCIACAALLLRRRWSSCRVEAERGLTAWPTVIALVALIAFAWHARTPLFAGPRQLVVHRGVPRETLEHARRFPVSFSAGVRRDGGAWRRLSGDRVHVHVSNLDRSMSSTVLALGVTAPVGTEVRLWAIPTAHCGDPTAPAPRTAPLATTTVPAEVLGFSVASTTETFNAVLVTRIELVPGSNCYALRAIPPPDSHRRTIEVADVREDLLAGSRLLAGRLLHVPIGTVESHISNARYRQRMQSSQRISPHMLLWGYFAQFIVEQLAGDPDAALGALFLCCSLLCFVASLVMLGAPEAPSATLPHWGHRQQLSSALLLGPFVSQLHSMVWNPSLSCHFPDVIYSFLLLAAAALLLLRNRAGFILTGCLAAYARYPGSYVLFVLLLARLALFRDDRSWSKRTMIWAIAAGAASIVVLLAHFGMTSGIGASLRAAWSEIYAEHYELPGILASVGRRIASFYFKLTLLTSGLLLVWPLVRDATAKLLVMVTLCYAATMMAVQVPHAHYFPVLAYCGAAAGLRAIAVRDKPLLTWSAVAVVLVATALAFSYVSA